MIKTLNNIFKQDKEKFVVPKGVQDCIPVTAIYDDGIFRVGKDKYSKSFKFTDINYAVASREDKEAMFLEYSELLNSLDSGATTKLTINNRRLNRLDFEKTILIPETGDELDEYREEYNKMLLDKATGANSTVQDKYVTISINKKNVDDARTYFARVGADLISHFSRLGSKCVELETDERLRIIHDFFRVGEETSYHFDIKETRKKGHDFKDYICPDSLEFESDYFKIGNRYGRVIFLREYASYIKDSMVAELTDMNRNLMMSIDIVPVPTDEAVREAENRLLGVETNITNWQRKQNQNNNFSATVPYDMEQQKKEMKEFLDDLTTRDQRMMFAVLTMVHTADTKEQLDNDTEALLTTARKHLCQFAVLKFQQMDGLNTVMPYGTRKIDTFRTLTTESLAVFIPFRVQDIYHENGIYYGQNVISKNMIIADRKQLLNGNSFILGVSGGGKSFAAKGEIENIILSSDADVIIIDPEREYSHLVNALGGEIINISATSKNHINAMDMNKDYGDGANPVILKSEFIMSLCEQLIGGTNLGAKQKSIIDRCTASVYRTYQQNDYTGPIPTLQDFRDELLKQTDSRGIVKKGQGVQVIYGPHVTVIKAKLEEYLETAPNEFADETPDNVQVHENAAAGNADGQNSAEVEDKNADTAQTLAPVKEEKIRKTAIIYSPVDGIAADLSTAPDEGFAGKMMGDGAVVTPTEGTVYAPADGEVEFIFDTKHAIGFQTDSGIPMLLHMGIDTVKLEGKGFEILVTEGQKVKKGDPMMKLDLEFLTANAPSITSPILDTEPEDNQRIRLLANGEIKAGEPLFAVETLE